MDRKREIQGAEIQAAVADIRAIKKRDGVTRESLEKIKQRLIRLAARRELFSASDFPPPAPGGKLKSCLYRVAEDPDHRTTEGAPRPKGEYVVKQGTGVYGLALDHLHKREYYKADEKAWRVFPAHGDIREAR